MYDLSASLESPRAPHSAFPRYHTRSSGRCITIHTYLTALVIPGTYRRFQSIESNILNFIRIFLVSLAISNYLKKFHSNNCCLSSLRCYLDIPFDN